MKRIKLFENFDSNINEGSVKQLWSLITNIEGNANMDPAQPWTPKQAIEWAVGFTKEFGMWHPDDSAQDIEWADVKPDDLAKADKQMDNFCNVDWKSVADGSDLDQYVVARFIAEVIGEEKGEMSWLSKSEYSNEVEAMSHILTESYSDNKGGGKNLIQYQQKVQEIFFNFLTEDADVMYLEKELRKIEDHARKTVGGVKDASLWFRFFKGDTGATTIKNIVDTLTPGRSGSNKSNYDYMIDSMKITSEMENEMEIYFS